MCKIFFISCLLVSSSFLCNAQQENPQVVIDSLKNEMLVSKPDTGKIKLLCLISYMYSTFDYDKGLKYARQAEILSAKINWKKGIAEVDLVLGLNYAGKCNYSEAIRYYGKSLDVYKEVGDKDGMGSVYANTGLLYMAKSEYPKALENDFKALNLLEELNDIGKKAIIQENIGSIYLEQKKYAKTLEYYSQSLESYKKINNKVGISRNLGNQGIIFNDLGEHTKALNYHLLALKINQETGNQGSIQVNLANIGITYCYLKKFPLALAYHLKALDLSKKLADSRSIAINLGNIGELYYFVASDTLAPDKQAENLRKAVSYLESAIAACEQIEFKGPNIEFSKFLSDAYLLSKNYKKALEIFKAYSLMEDSVFSQETRLKIADLETRRQIDIKNKDIALKDRQIQIEELQVINKHDERLIFLVSTCLLFIIIFLLYRLFRLRDKTHKKVMSDIANIQSHGVRAPLARILGLIKLFDQKNPAAQINKKVVNAIYQSAIELDEVVRKTIDKAAE